MKDKEDGRGRKEGALSFVAWEADYLSGKLNAAQLGILQAAKDKGVYANGRSTEHTDVAPDSVLTNIVEKWADMYGAAAEESKAGTIGGKFGLSGPGKKGRPGGEIPFKGGKKIKPILPPALVLKIS